MQSNYILDPRLTYISNNRLKSLNLFWSGYLIFILAYTLTTTIVYLSYVMLQAVQLVGLMMFLTGLTGLVKFKFDNKFFGFLFTLFFSWQIITIFRGFQFNSDFIKLMIFDPGFGIFTYLAPAIVLFPRNLSFYKKLFNVIIILNIFYLIYNLIFYKDITNSDRTSLRSQGMMESFTIILAFHAGFILLTYIYHSSKRRFFTLGILLLTILLAIYRARRGLIFMCVTTLLCYFMIYLITTKKKFLIIYASVLLSVVTIYYISNIYKQSEGGLFGYLMARGDEDTRSGVEEYMIADMSETDWIIGKGIAGEYYCPNIDVNDVTGYRSVIETGYLQMMLKGGAVSLVLYLLIGIPAMFLGLFASKNILSKACGMWILLSTIYIYPIVVTGFDVRYLIYWLAISICYSKKLRNIPDDVLKEFFQRKDKISKELFF
ncbi:MAG: hypothetical protein WBP16_13015 [Ferruginibacter sp.]